jgi:CYTH domain-containing protein
MIERERKFLVASLPDDLGSPTHIRQGYLAVDGAVEVRVRWMDVGSTVTVKGGTGRDRTEVELPVDRDLVDELWPLTDGRRLEKDRHRVPLDGGLTAEVDLYRGHLSGLRTVEVEFDGADQADGFSAPDWFGPEVTDDDAYGNAALASADGPPR